MQLQPIPGPTGPHERKEPRLFPIVTNFFRDPLIHRPFKKKQEKILVRSPLFRHTTAQLSLSPAFFISLFIKKCFAWIMDMVIDRSNTLTSNC